MPICWSLIVLGLAASPAVAFWRLPCTAPLVVERADPIISAGQVSNHLHQILGGNGFGFSMTYNDTQKSTCSSCTVQGDYSNYWTPNLWYKYQNGSFESVPQVGGATVYYLQRNGNTNNTLLAFKEGFRMVAGDPFKRSPGTDFASQAISYACLNYNDATPETPGFPTTDCPDGLRAQVFFPSCWDGVNLDPPDHKSHMAYPIQNYNDGTCPDTHPVQLVSIFYEVTFSITNFVDMWYDGTFPFVWSMGDPTGYGFHGDFINGWDVELLQDAVNDCTDLSGNVEDCSHFTLTPNNVAQGCTILPQVDEPTSGILDALPGCNPIQPGPNEATIQTGCGATTNLSATGSYFTDLTSDGWAYVGCGTDNYYNRILTGVSTSNQNMTNKNCVDFCAGKGFSIAGSEYSDECYCGNSIPSAGEPTPGVVGNCKMPCAGDSSENCGGYSLISLYRKCTGSSCVNAEVGGANSGSGSTASGTSSSVTSFSSSSTTATNAVNKSTTLAVLTLSSTSQISTAAAIQATTSPAKTYAATTSQQASSGTTSSISSTASANTIPAGWSYVGCYTDTLTPRSLPVWSGFNGAQMSNAACINFCSEGGYALAGTEYAGQCFCGNSINSTVLGETSCNMACTGAAEEMCGGPAALSLWTAGTGSVSRRRSRRGWTEALSA